MTIENATLNISEDDVKQSISCVVDGQNISIPLKEDNRHYQLVLDAIIEQGADCWDGDIPTELQAAADTKLHNTQLIKYGNAIERLSKFVVADGREEVTEEVVLRQEFDDEAGDMVDITETRVVSEAIDPVPATITITSHSGNIEDSSTTSTIENPLITRDNAERAEAQAVVDSTPSEVVDAYNAL
jgi:uncharacterized Fe-S cluster protein YjdI